MANSSSEKPRFKIEIRNILQDPWLTYPSTERMQDSWRVLYGICCLSLENSLRVRFGTLTTMARVDFVDETKRNPSLPP